MPHLRECWWDHVFIDILCANTPATLLALECMNKWGIKEYDLLGRKGKRSFREWEVWHCHNRFLMMVMLIYLVVVNFLSGFFFANSLWIKPKSWINKFRLLAAFAGGFLAFAEGNLDVTTYGTSIRKKLKVGYHCRWVCFFMFNLEFWVAIKFRHGAGNLVEAAHPLYVVIPWAIVIISMALFYIHLRMKEDATTLTTGGHQITYEG